MTGLIAGALTDNDKIGYVAGYPVYGVTANINAFALGQNLLIHGQRFILNGPL